jgi:hypothetical protein
MVRRAALLRYCFRWDSFAGIIHPVLLYGGPSVTRALNPGYCRFKGGLARIARSSKWWLQGFFEDVALGYEHHLPPG